MSSDIVWVSTEDTGKVGKRNLSSESLAGFRYRVCMHQPSSRSTMHMRHIPDTVFMVMWLDCAGITSSPTETPSPWTLSSSVYTSSSGIRMRSIVWSQFVDVTAINNDMKAATPLTMHASCSRRLLHRTSFMAPTENYWTAQCVPHFHRWHCCLPERKASTVEHRTGRRDFVIYSKVNGMGANVKRVCRLQSLCQR